MSYSCADFTDDILRILEIDLTDDERQDTGTQAELAVAEIERLQVVEINRTRMKARLVELLAAIKSHYDGDEQDLDVIAESIVKEFKLKPEIDFYDVKF